METKKEKIILVTGASGRQGGAVARNLAAGGWPLRALVRDVEKQTARALKARGIELVKGDLEDRASLDRALRGVYGVFSVQTWAENGVASEVVQGRNLADAAKAAGVKHFIYSSVGGAERRSGIPHFDSKWEIEEHINAIGLPVTVFRPVFFMHNFNAPEIHSSILGGILAMPLRVDRPLQMLAVENLGDFVRLAFEDPNDYIGKAVELAGDEMIMPRAAEIFGKLIGKTVHYVEQPVKDIRRFNRDIAKMFEWFNEHGYRADIPALRALHPRLMNLETWLKKTRWAMVA